MMSLPIFFPPNLSLNKTCDRCGLRYSRKEPKCPHCAHLSDNEVDQLKAQLMDEKEGNANLGKYFLVIAALILLFMIAYLV